uniref:Uncharacterized protein n=1 Tax=Ammopiptanthus mongolicus TaxID=126911 RepID=A0A385G298_AMMMO|nr:hypothetical protein [Ammopiptanthus mongolicus]AXV54322.1 hypothetical protein [Ammopiptanthus mongolicus]
MYLVWYGTVQYETMECNGMDGRGLPAPKSDDSLVPLGVSTSLARGWDSFTCIPASTTKSSGLNAPTTALQPFLGFVESGFPFTHNGGAAPTRPGRRPRVITHSSHNKSTLKLTYPLGQSSECGEILKICNIILVVPTQLNLLTARSRRLIFSIRGSDGCGGTYGTI